MNGTVLNSSCGEIQRLSASRRSEMPPASPTKCRKVFGRVAMDIRTFTTLAAKEILDYAEKLPRTLGKKILRIPEIIQSCQRISMSVVKASPSEGKTAERKFRCGRLNCLWHRRARTEARYAHLLRMLDDLVPRAMRVAQSQLDLLKPRLQKAKASYARAHGTSREKRQKRRLTCLRELRSELRSVKDHRWYFVTLQPRYDPTDPASVDVRALRTRALACKAMAQALHSSFTPEERACMAWVSQIECGPHGLVHLHVLYRGPSRRRKDFAAVIEGIHDERVKVHAKRVPDDDVPKVLRYVTKPDGIGAKLWKRFRTGVRCKVPHPVLDARFVLATRGIHRTVAGGLMRGGAR